MMHFLNPKFRTFFYETMEFGVFSLHEHERMEQENSKVHIHINDIAFRKRMGRGGANSRDIERDISKRLSFGNFGFPLFLSFSFLSLRTALDFLPFAFCEKTNSTLFVLFVRSFSQGPSHSLPFCTSRHDCKRYSLFAFAFYFSLFAREKRVWPAPTAYVLGSDLCNGVFGGANQGMHDR